MPSWRISSWSLGTFLFSFFILFIPILFVYCMMQMSVIIYIYISYWNICMSYLYHYLLIYFSLLYPVILKRLDIIWKKRWNFLIEKSYIKNKNKLKNRQGFFYILQLEGYFIAQTFLVLPSITINENGDKLQM